MNKRPLAVTIIACLFIVVGIAGAVAHLMEPRTAGSYDPLWAALVNVVALVSGIFMFRASNWARWLAIGWMLFHVVLSFFHSMSEVAIHCVFLAALVYFLTRPDVNRYFRA
ncbi:MAG TPA: hypothetical protein VGL53_12355 [Bryobacteraceae bacterium]|jgi:hypothetical protein